MRADEQIKKQRTPNFVLLPAGGQRKIASEEQSIKLVTGETDEPIKTPPSAAPVRYQN
jgi:hypothetical protein